MGKIIYNQDCTNCDNEHDVLFIPHTHIPEEHQEQLCSQCVFDKKHSQTTAMFFNALNHEPNLFRPCEKVDEGDCQGFRGNGKIYYYEKGFDSDWKKTCGGCWKVYGKSY